MSNHSHHYRGPAPFNPSGTFHDGELRNIARKFLKLPEFVDSEFDRGQEYVLTDNPKQKKHVSRFPNTRKYGVHQFIKGRRRFFAFGTEKQMDDLLRFADATTFLFWKYRQRGSEAMDPKQFNFSIAATESDLGDWPDTMPEVMGLIKEIEDHFLNAGIFVPPAERVNKAGRISDGAFRHQELIDMLAGVCERLDVIETQLKLLPAAVSVVPVMPVTTTTYCGGPPSDGGHIDELEANDKL